MAHHPWVKTGENTYEQSYGFMERFFTRFLGEEGKPSQFTIIATLELSVPNSSIGTLESDLRSTWRAMRFHSPGLATFTGPTGKIYHTATPETLSAWESATFIRHPLNTQASALFSTLTRASLVTLHFLPGTTSHQLILQAEHHNIDGRGVYHLFNRFLTILTTPSLRTNLPFGTEWARLPPLMDDLLSLSPISSADETALAAEWISPVSSITPLTIPIPPPLRSRPPSQSLRTSLRLSRAETSALIAACKTHNLTVTSAWIAALALSLAQTAPDDAPTAGLATFATIDMRRFFPSPFDASEAPVACYHSAIPIALPILGKSFIELAREVKTAFHGGSITEPRKTAWIPFVEMMGNAVGGREGTESGVLISSLGVVDDYVRKRYGDVEVVDVWIGDVMMGGTSLWMCETWDGRLAVSVTYNEAYFGEGQMKGVLERVRGEMLRGLGVESGGMD
ncbi:hypothetical protein OQA88_9168 [Cercophora sp. LCS_1]